MRTYELSLILTEAAGKEDSSAKKIVTELVSQVKGKIKDTKVWGIRELAYPIKGQSKGWYGMSMVEMEEKAVGELDKTLKMKAEVIRYLLVRAE